MSQKVEYLRNYDSNGLQILQGSRGGVATVSQMSLDKNWNISETINRRDLKFFLGILGGVAHRVKCIAHCAKCAAHRCASIRGTYN